MLVLEQNDPPVVTAVEPGSAAAIAGIRVGDQIVEVDGTMPRDIIEWHVAIDEKRIPLVLRRGDSMFETTINRETLEPLPQGRRLSPEFPLRKFHHAHTIHGVRF